MRNKLLGLVLTLTVLLPVVVFAQEALPIIPDNFPAPDPNLKPIIVASINLSGATILKETPQSITVGLDLENQGTSPQSDIINQPSITTPFIKKI